MKISLATEDNAVWRAPIEKTGMNIVEHDPGVEPFLLAESLLSAGADWILIQPVQRVLDALERIISKPGFPSRILALSDRIDDRTRNRLISNGIVDLLKNPDPAFIPSYFTSIDGIKPLPGSSVLVLDDNRRSRAALASILHRFRQTTRYITSLDALVEGCAEPSIQLAIINIATTGLDLNALVRKHAASGEMKKIPILAFRDMSSGISVHEMTCGLNRLTRYILTPAELYSCLVDLLFRRELAGPVERLVHDSALEQNLPLAKDPLRKAYRLAEGALSVKSGLLDEPVLKRIAVAADGIRDLVIRTRGLKWLCGTAEIETISTCVSGD